MSDPFIGEIRIFPYNFAPVNWAMCTGSLIPIQVNPALSVVVGQHYTNPPSTTSFALPNLQGTVPLAFGQGPGLSPYVIGKNSGVSQVALHTEQMPSHSHTVKAGLTAFTNMKASPCAATYLSRVQHPTGTTVAPMYLTNAKAPTAEFSPAMVGDAGGGGAHENRQPYLTLNFCIALYGVYPVNPLPT